MWFLNTSRKKWLEKALKANSLQGRVNYKIKYCRSTSYFPQLHVSTEKKGTNPIAYIQIDCIHNMYYIQVCIIQVEYKWSKLITDRLTYIAHETKNPYMISYPPPS